MVDISAIAGVVSALKGATDIARAMKDLNDAAAIQGKVIQLNAKILDAQSSAFAANDERLALIERASELEKEVARLKAWDAEKERYQFAQVSTGVFAYTLKPSMAHGEPSHMLCANCYQRGEKSVLQATQELRKARRVHRCHHCEAEYELTGSATNPAPTRANSDFDVFTGK